MLKLLAKKGKSNKGFTLIELIVVIAIIAILALLLVPRFAGFTEDARVANDRNACETIERGFMTLIANGTFHVPAGGVTYDIDPDGDYTSGAAQLEDAAGNTIADTDVQDAMENLTDTLSIQATTRHTVGWAVTINADGTVRCTVS